MPPSPLLSDLLGNKTATPLTLTLFRDAYLPLYDPSSRLSSLLQLHSWAATYTSSFYTLPMEEQEKALPPSDPTLVAGIEDLPFRVELDCALVHYMSAGRVPDEIKQDVLDMAKATTHPDVLLPIVFFAEQELEQAAQSYLRDAIPNISPKNRNTRAGLAMIAIFLGCAVLGACFGMSVNTLWRLVPLPWMSIAIFYLILTSVFGLEPVRWWFGMAEAGISLTRLEAKEKGKNAPSRRKKMVMILDAYVRRAQTRRALLGIATSLLVSIALCTAVMIIPNSTPSSSE